MMMVSGTVSADTNCLAVLRSDGFFAIACRFCDSSSCGCVPISALALVATFSGAGTGAPSKVCADVVVTSTTIRIIVKILFIMGK